MDRKRLYVATIAEDCVQLAAEYGLGLEVDEFTTAENMDGDAYIRVKRELESKLNVSDRYLLHAPFAELCPAAIDPLVAEAAWTRYQQAARIALEHGIKKMVVHSGYIRGIYYPEWYREKAAAFWRRFLSDKPEDFQLLVENVMDDEPFPLLESVELTADPRCRICLDIGHAAVHGRVPVTDFISSFAPYLAHVHLHDNDYSFDRHLPLGQGRLPFLKLLEAIEKTAAPTYTLENMTAQQSVRWLLEQGILK